MAAKNTLGNGVTEVLKRLSFLIAEEIKLTWGFKDDLKKLQNTVNMMLAVIDDAAEKKQVKEEEMVRLWLKSLKDLADEANDVLDYFSYERKRRGDKLKRKRDINPLIFSFKMADKIKDINRKFDELGQFPSLKQLTLHGMKKNNLESWEQLSGLGQLPSLKQLKH